MAGGKGADIAMAKRSGVLDWVRKTTVSTLVFAALGTGTFIDAG
jgi:hypothetical protein